MRKGLTSTVAMMALVTSMFAGEGVLREDLRTAQAKTGEMDPLSKEMCKGDVQSDPIRTFKCFEQHIRVQEINEAKELAKGHVKGLVSNKIWGKMTMVGTANYTDKTKENYAVCEIRINEQNSSPTHKLIERQCYTPNFAGNATIDENLWGRHGYYAMDQDPKTQKWFVTEYIGR